MMVESVDRAVQAFPVAQQAFGVPFSDGKPRLCGLTRVSPHILVLICTVMNMNGVSHEGCVTAWRDCVFELIISPPPPHPPHSA